MRRMRRISPRAKNSLTAGTGRTVIVSALVFGVVACIGHMAVSTDTPAPAPQVVAQAPAQPAHAELSPAVRQCLINVGYADSAPAIAVDECEASLAPQPAPDGPELVVTHESAALGKATADKPKTTRKHSVSTSKKGSTVTDTVTTKSSTGSTTVTTKTSPTGTTVSTSRTSS